MSIYDYIKTLPRTPGCYIFRDKRGSVLYIGKATVLKTRVSSYFQNTSKVTKRPIDEVLEKIKTIETIKTDTVIEALLLEAELIKKYWPEYNVLGKDSRSFLWVGITREDFPKVLLIRGKQLEENEYARPRQRSKLGQKPLVALFGPYTSASAIRSALKIIRKIFSYSSCSKPVKGGKVRACFYRGIDLCPGVCTGEITKGEYRKNIKRIISFFLGKKKDIIHDLKIEMKKASGGLEFEKAAHLRNQIKHLEHIQDIAVIGQRNGVKLPLIEIDVFGRIEGYDISNISGEYAVGSMVVSVGGHADKSEYRRFMIKSVKGVNDVLMLEEVIRRRFAHIGWERPELLLIDGGLPQVNRVVKVLKELDIIIPIIGIAKGRARKKNQFVIPKQPKKMQEDLTQITRLYPHILIGVRDEAHRFARSYYRKRHRKSLKKVSVDR